MGSSFRRFTRHVVAGWSVARPITYFVIMHCSLVSLVFLAASCFTAPLEDTPEVVAARANFHKVFDLAEAGLLGQFAPVNNDIQAAPIPAAYIADTEDVAIARASFKATFADVEAGGLAALQASAPVHVVAESVDDITIKPLTKTAEPLTKAVEPVAAAAVTHSPSAAAVKPESIPMTYVVYPWGAYPPFLHSPYTTKNKGDAAHPNLFAYSYGYPAYHTPYLLPYPLMTDAVDTDAAKTDAEASPLVESA